MKRMRSILLVGFCLVSTFAAAFGQQVLLGTTGSAAGDLYQINPNTGAATLIGPLMDNSFTPVGVTGLAFDNLTGILFGSTSNNSAGDKQSLVTIDPNTGFVSVVGLFGVGTTMSDLTFDATTATLYGAGAVNGNLYTINMSTGLATLVGNAGFPPLSTVGNGLAANAGGTLYGTPNGPSGPLVTYNKSNGSVTNGPTLSGAPFPTGAIGALAFNGTDTLFGENTNQTTNARPTHLIAINTTTGAISDIGASVDNLDAIVFYNPTAVPEPSTVALFGVGLIFLTIVGVRRSRRCYS